MAFDIFNVHCRSGREVKRSNRHRRRRIRCAEHRAERWADADANRPAAGDGVIERMIGVPALIPFPSHRGTGCRAPQA